MNSTMKIILPLFIIVLLLISTIIPSITAETKLIKDEKSNLARKHIIYISGDGLKEIKYNDYCFEGPINLFYRFYGFNGSYVRLFFKDATNILMIKDGVPRTIQGPVDLEFGLSDPNTFAFLLWSREGKSIALGYCLYIIIDQHIMI